MGSGTENGLRTSASGGKIVKSAVCNSDILKECYDHLQYTGAGIETERVAAA